MRGATITSVACVLHRWTAIVAGGGGSTPLGTLRWPAIESRKARGVWCPAVVWVAAEVSPPCIFQGLSRNVSRGGCFGHGIGPICRPATKE